MQQQKYKIIIRNIERFVETFSRFIYVFSISLKDDVLFRRKSLCFIRFGTFEALTIEYKQNQSNKNSRNKKINLNL